MCATRRGALRGKALAAAGVESVWSRRLTIAGVVAMLVAYALGFFVSTFIRLGPVGKTIAMYDLALKSSGRDGLCTNITLETTSDCDWVRVDEWDEELPPRVSCGVQDDDSAFPQPLTSTWRRRVIRRFGIPRLWQTRWHNTSLVTSDGLVLPCRNVWNVDTQDVFSSGLCEPASTENRPDGLCDIDVAPLMQAWRRAGRDAVTGYKVGAPSLLKHVHTPHHTTLQVNRAPAYDTKATEMAILRVYDAAVSMHGYVFNDNMVVRSRLGEKYSDVDMTLPRPTAGMQVERLLVLQSAWADDMLHFGFDLVPKIVLATDLASRMKDLTISHIGGTFATELLPVRCGIAGVLVWCVACVCVCVCVCVRVCACVCAVKMWHSPAVVCSVSGAGVVALREVPQAARHVPDGRRGGAREGGVPAAVRAGQRQCAAAAALRAHVGGCSPARAHDADAHRGAQQHAAQRRAVPGATDNARGPRAPQRQERGGDARRRPRLAVVLLRARCRDRLHTRRVAARRTAGGAVGGASSPAGGPASGTYMLSCVVRACACACVLVCACVSV